MYTIARETGLELLIGRQRYSTYVAGDHAHVRHAAYGNRSGASVRGIDPVARRCACHKPTVVAPVETEPWPTRPRLVLHVRRLVVFLVMVDTEDAAGCGGCRTGSGDLRQEEARGYAGHHDVSRKAMKVR